MSSLSTDDMALVHVLRRLKELESSCDFLTKRVEELEKTNKELVADLNLRNSEEEFYGFRPFVDTPYNLAARVDSLVYKLTGQTDPEHIERKSFVNEFGSKIGHTMTKRVWLSFMREQPNKVTRQEFVNGMMLWMDREKKENQRHKILQVFRMLDRFRRNKVSRSDMFEFLDAISHSVFLPPDERLAVTESTAAADPDNEELQKLRQEEVENIEKQIASIYVHTDCRELLEDSHYLTKDIFLKMIQGQAPCPGVLQSFYERIRDYGAVAKSWLPK